jgi:hypothetical protein
LIGNVVSWTVHFVIICVENQQMQQLFMHLSEGTRNAPWRWQYNAETCRSYHT